MALTSETAAALVNEIFDLQRAVRCIAASAPRGDGMSAALHFVLRLVREGECRANGLAVRLGIGAPVLSRHLAELQEQGMVSRKQDPEDGRAQLVSITPRGAEVLRRLEAQRSTAFQNHLWAWNEEEAQDVAQKLRQLTQSLTGPSSGMPQDLTFDPSQEDSREAS